jgi:hypothetical protein
MPYTAHNACEKKQAKTDPLLMRDDGWGKIPVRAGVQITLTLV